MFVISCLFCYWYLNSGGLRWQGMTQVVESEVLSLTLPTVIATNTHLLASTATGEPSSTREPSPIGVSTQTLLATVTLFPLQTAQTTKSAQSSPSTVREYIVRSGDTFSGIASQFDILLPDLLEANPDINPSRLSINDVLIIPSKVVSFSSALTMEEYTVKSGDSLFQIARQFNLSVDELYEANPDMRSDSIDIGDVILIPVIEQLTVAKTPTSANRETNTYSVRAGDTLLDIAIRFNISLEELQTANPNLNSTRLKIDDLVLIPNPSEEKE